MTQQKLKYCIDCKVTKPLEEFYLKKDSKDGHHSYCRNCHNIRNKKASDKWKRTPAGKQHMREYSAKLRNIPKWKEYNRNYSREYQKSEKGLEQRRLIDKRKRFNPAYKVHANMSRMIRSAIRKGKEGKSWIFFVDYSLNQLIDHLQRQFTPKMTWGNYGSYWHIDHITPRSYFKYTSPCDDEFRQCWKLSNLQPLEAIENIKKSNKVYETICK